MKGLLKLIDKKSAIHDEQLAKYLGKIYTKSLSKLSLVTLCSFVLILAPGFLYYLNINKKEPEFNIVSPSKKTVEKLQVLDLPNLSAGKIENWTAKAVKDSFSFDFYSIDQKMDENRYFFTNSGWDAFYRALNSSKILENITTKQLVVWLTPTSPAYVVASERIKGYEDYVVWRVEMPAVITYVGASSPANQKVLVTALVIQVPTTISPFGVQISQLNIQ